MPDRQRWDETRKQGFLEVFARIGNVTASAEAVGMSRVAVYSLRSRDHEFAMAMDEAKSVAVDRLEEAARQRAVDGWDEVTYEVKAVEVDDPESDDPKIVTELVETKRVRRVSDTILLRLLEAHDPRFKRGVQVEAGEKFAQGIQTLADVIRLAEADDEAGE